MTPIQVLEVRLEAPTPDDAIQEISEAVLGYGLDVTWIREEE